MSLAFDEPRPVRREAVGLSVQVGATDPPGASYGGQPGDLEPGTDFGDPEKLGFDSSRRALVYFDGLPRRIPPSDTGGVRSRSCLREPSGAELDA